VPKAITKVKAVKKPPTNETVVYFTHAVSREVDKIVITIVREGGAIDFKKPAGSQMPIVDDPGGKPGPGKPGSR